MVSQGDRVARAKQYWRRIQLGIGVEASLSALKLMLNGKDAVSLEEIGITQHDIRVKERRTNVKRGKMYYLAVQISGSRLDALLLQELVNSRLVTLKEIGVSQAWYNRLEQTIKRFDVFKIWADILAGVEVRENTRILRLFIERGDIDPGELEGFSLDRLHRLGAE